MRNRGLSAAYFALFLSSLAYISSVNVPYVGIPVGLAHIYFSRAFRLRSSASQAHRKDSGFKRGAVYT